MPEQFQWHVFVGPSLTSADVDPLEITMDAETRRLIHQGDPETLGAFLLAIDAFTSWRAED